MFINPENPLILVILILTVATGTDFVLALCQTAVQSFAGVTPNPSYRRKPVSMRLTIRLLKPWRACPWQ